MLDGGKGAKVYQDRATWTVTSNHCTRKDADDNAAANVWVGLGDLGEPLVQTGLTDACVLSHGHVTQVNQAFWKVVGADGSPSTYGRQQLSDYANIGDQVTALVTYLPSVGPDVYRFDLHDLTTGWEWSLDYGIAYNGYPEFDEVAVEATWHQFAGVNIGHDPLADFGTITFTGVRYWTVGNKIYPVRVFEVGNPPEAYVTATLGTWTVTWNNAYS